MQQYSTVLGLSLIIAGFALAILSVVLLFRAGRVKGSGGAIILIGPIPIILGSDRRTTILMMVLAIVLVFLFVVSIYGSGL